MESYYWEMLMIIIILVIIIFTDQFIPTGAIFSNRSTTQLMKLPVLLFPICLSSQNKDMKSW